MRLASACLLITSVSVLLVGCSLAPTKNVLEQQKAVAVYSWEAQGQMVFRCTYDERGFFWAFLYPQGKLLDDKGREQAVLGSDFSVTARDGSFVKGHIVEQGPQESARNLRTAVIAVESTNHGLLSGVRSARGRHAARLMFGFSARTSLESSVSCPLRFLSVIF